MKRNPRSMGTPLMERTVCGRCHHFHRPRLRFKCECCRADAQKVYGALFPLAAPTPELYTTTTYGAGEGAA